MIQGKKNGPVLTGPLGLHWLALHCNAWPCIALPGLAGLSPRLAAASKDIMPKTAGNVNGNQKTPGNETYPGALDMINASFLNYLARGVNHEKKNSTFSFLRQDPLTAAAFLGMVKIPNLTKT